VKLRKENLSLNVTTLELEEALMRLWSTAEDVETLFKYFYERHEDMTVDEMANALLGIQQMIQMRSELAFELFEQLLKEIPREPRDETTTG
jgi:hypothetical protein